jgi:hypothetical protein
LHSGQPKSPTPVTARGAAEVTARNGSISVTVERLCCPPLPLLPLMWLTAFRRPTRSSLARLCSPPPWGGRHPGTRGDAAGARSSRGLSGGAVILSAPEPSRQTYLQPRKGQHTCPSPLITTPL